MDVDNGYFLVKFQCPEDYEKVFTQGLWIVLGQYLTMQLWTPKFNPLQAFPSNTMVWVRLPGLSGYLYKRCILEEIGSLIGKVTKLDFQTDKRSRGKFARMAVYINLGKPLVSQILVNGVVQRVVFKSLPSVCFSCGRFDHLQNLCFGSGTANDTKIGMDVTAVASLEKNNVAKLTKAFGPWMLVERKSQRNPRTRQNLDKETNRNDVVIPNGIKTTEERTSVADLLEVNFKK
ncbi:hypothetical protein J1N35_035441 [Gossypium stocksii]|uniref:DUF4283 domain-containing protein n=1 Tax=Gossypium stocksii TaxID=47602 RepID=A0A9D3UTX6_9ROSI|nr:hypothetical protein J1N35_035441 [Gossypium stocksii]